MTAFTFGQNDRLLSTADSNLGRPLFLPPGGQNCVIRVHNLLAHTAIAWKRLAPSFFGWKVNCESPGCSFGEHSSLLSLFSLFFISFRFKSLIKIGFCIDLFWLSLYVICYFFKPVGLYLLVNVLYCFFFEYSLSPFHCPFSLWVFNDISLGCSAIFSGFRDSAIVFLSPNMLRSIKINVTDSFLSPNLLSHSLHPCWLSSLVISAQNPL